MIEVLQSEDKTIITLKMSGMISDADFDDTEEKLLEILGPEAEVRVRGANDGAYRVLLDWEALDGWEKGVKTLGTLTAMAFSDLIGRVAIVGDERWRDEVPRVEDACKRARVRFFPAAQREAALAWLRDE